MLEHPRIRWYSFPRVVRTGSSDNPSGADNQQERPSTATWLDEVPRDLGHYIAGFVDGEGSFIDTYDFDANGFVKRTLDRIHRSQKKGRRPAYSSNHRP